MADITLNGNIMHTIGDIPPVGAELDDIKFKLTRTDLTDVDISDFKGKRIILNVFVSLDTEVCANSVRRFNKEAGELENTVVLCISRDLPFAHKRFCTTEGINDVIPLSELRNSTFSDRLGLKIVNGPFSGLIARAVIILDENLRVIYSQLVQEITLEPDYEKALQVLK